MRPRRHRAWVGFAVFAALAVLGLFVLHGGAGAVVLIVAMLVFVGACLHALRGSDPDMVKRSGGTGLAGWFGGWF